MVAGALLTACGASAAGTTVPAPIIGPDTGGVHLVLDVGSAHPGDVVSATVVGNRAARSSRVIEVTCGVKDTRVSHPVLGLAGPGRPSASRAPFGLPLDTPAHTPLRFVVPDVATGVCFVSRAVVSGSTLVVPRAPLFVH